MIDLILFWLTILDEDFRRSSKKAPLFEVDERGRVWVWGLLDPVDQWTKSSPSIVQNKIQSWASFYAKIKRRKQYKRLIINGM